METAAEVSILSVIGLFMAIIFLIAVGVVFLNLQFQKNLFKQQLAKEELKNKHQLDLLQSSIAVQEGERKRIAENLHDELGAILSISRMRLVQFEKTAQQLEEEQQQTLTDIRSYIETSIASMRRISHELIPPQLEQFGLIATLESVTQQLSNTNNIACTFSSNLDATQLNWPAQIGIYRVLMELINNTIKHAQATEININITTKKDQLVCHYTDNGVGLPKELAATGLGFKNIEGRIKALEGKWTILDETDLTGFNAKIQIPYANQTLE
ncbi:MAG: histidine kinase [Bacteroidia bacterium]|jgi:signal transduction histidine kinase|nr:histidine kinase [Bacteroidia bacterium]